jgi:hypothetical protein
VVLGEGGPPSFLKKRVFLKKKELSDFIYWDLDLYKTANIFVPLPTHSFGFCSCMELI